MKEIQAVPGAAESGYNEQVWNDMGAGDVGKPHDVVGYGMAAFQIVGGVRDSAGVVIKGRLNGSSDFVTLPDDDGFAVSLVETRIVQVSSLCVREIRPEIVGGTENTKISVAVLLKR